MIKKTKQNNNNKTMVIHMVSKEKFLDQVVRKFLSEDMMFEFRRLIKIVQGRAPLEDRMCTKT